MRHFFQIEVWGTRAIAHGFIDRELEEDRHEALAEALSGRLETITALPPAAALFPWKGEKDGDRPRDLFGPGAERIYELAEVRELEAERRRAARRALPQVRPMRRPAKPAPIRATR